MAIGGFIPVSLCILLFLTKLTSVFSEAASGRCPHDYLPYTQDWAERGESCYQFVYLEKFWDEARDFCRWYGGKLVKINDYETSEFIKYTLNGLPWHNKGVWIGLHDLTSELTWEWVTNEHQVHELMSWSNWDSGHPGAFWHTRRDCVRMVRDGGAWKWHETFCHALKFHYRFICEYKLEPITTTSTSTFRTPTPGAHFGGEPRVELETSTPLWQGHAPTVEHRTRVREATTSASQQTPVTPAVKTDVQTVEYEPTVAEKEVFAAASSQIINEKGNNPGLAAGVVVCVVGLVLALLILALVFVRRRRRRNAKGEDSFGNPVYDVSDTSSETGGVRLGLIGGPSRPGERRKSSDYVVSCGDSNATPPTSHTDNHVTRWSPSSLTGLASQPRERESNIYVENDMDIPVDKQKSTPIASDVSGPPASTAYEVPLSRPSQTSTESHRAQESMSSPPTVPTSGVADEFSSAIASPPLLRPAQPLPGYMSMDGSPDSKRMKQNESYLYDMPKPMNVYEEISERAVPNQDDEMPDNIQYLGRDVPTEDIYINNENIYEDIDECRRNAAHAESEA